MGKTPVEWAQWTWNTLCGCTKKSTGCKYCYAEKLHNMRYQAWLDGWTEAPRQYHVPFSQVQVLDGRMQIPLKRRAPTRFFVNSMSDTFHTDVPDAHIVELLDTIGQCQIAGRGHTFYVLTKRPDRAADLLLEYYRSRSIRPYENLQLGTSTENQQAANERIPPLLKAPARRRFLSCEPLLGMIDLGDWICCPDCKGEGDKIEIIPVGQHRSYSSRNTYTMRREKCRRCKGTAFFTHLSWIIGGGESGDEARPMHPFWIGELRNQASYAKIAFFFKQWGEWRPADLAAINRKLSMILLNQRGARELVTDQTDISAMVRQGYTLMERVGRRRAGRLLEGVEYSELAV